MRNTIGRAPAAAAAVALALVLLALTAGTARAATHQVAISGFAFAPATVNAAVGDTVTWTNQDSAPHTVSATAGGGFDSGNMATGATFSHTFSSAGTFAYRCNIHPEMTGSVVVAAASGSSGGGAGGGSTGGGTTTPAAPATGTGIIADGGGGGGITAAGMAAGLALALAGGAAAFTARRSA